MQPRYGVYEYSCVHVTCCSFIFFFFQAEDGIRDLTVAGVQTCALPISRNSTGGNLQASRPSRPLPGTPRLEALAILASRSHRSTARSRGPVSQPKAP